MESNTIVELTDAEIYQRENLILSGVNLKVESGEFIYVIGKVGTGKSSLIKTLHGEIPLFSGRGNVVGFELNGMKHREIADLRRKLGVVFQDFKLLPDRNVFENVALSLRVTGAKNAGRLPRLTRWMRRRGSNTPRTSATRTIWNGSS